MANPLAQFNIGGEPWGNVVTKEEQRAENARRAAMTSQERRAENEMKRAKKLAERERLQRAYEREMAPVWEREAEEELREEEERERLQAEIAALEARRRDAERRLREAEAATEEARKAADLLKKTTKYLTKEGALKRISKPCKWECQGEVCWAKEEGACPFLHRGDPGYNRAHPIPGAFIQQSKKAGPSKKKGGARRMKKRTMTRKLKK